MKTFNRICIQDFEIKSRAGESFTLKRGKEYLTSDVENKQVMVFSTYWVKVPVSIFAGGIKFTL